MAGQHLSLGPGPGRGRWTHTVGFWESLEIGLQDARPLPDPRSPGLSCSPGRGASWATALADGCGV